MANDYNFLSLVNDVNRSLNEVELNASNFLDSKGVYADNKNAVNAAVRFISHKGVDWPFSHTTSTLTLTPGEIRYPYPTDAKKVDFNTFRLKGSDTLNTETRSLFNIDYEDYLRKYSDMEYRPDRYEAVPTLVFRTPGMQIGVLPAPRLAYQVVYEYFRSPPDMFSAEDVPFIPEQFKYVIHDGAMYYAYMFRGDTEAASVQKSLFDAGIDSMVSLYINRYEYLRPPRFRV